MSFYPFFPLNFCAPLVVILIVDVVQCPLLLLLALVVPFAFCFLPFNFCAVDSYCSNPCISLSLFPFPFPLSFSREQKKKKEKERKVSFGHLQKLLCTYLWLSGWTEHTKRCLIGLFQLIRSVLLYFKISLVALVFYQFCF